MKSIVKRWVAGMAFLGAVALMLCPSTFQASLTDLFPVKVGDTPLPAEGLAKYTGMLNIVLQSPDFDAARKNADRLYQKMIAAGIQDITYRVPENMTAQMIDFLKKHKNSYVTDKTRLSSTEAVRQRAVQKVKTSLAPTVLPLREDPFLLMSDYVQNMPRPMSLWNEKEGVLHQFSDGENYILMVAPLEKKDVYLMMQQIDLIKQTPLSAATKLHLSGAPVHTEQMFQKCRREIAVISVLSLLGLLILTYRLFRTRRALLLGAMNLGIGFLCGCVALFLFCPAVHILTFAFGSSLIGLCIDYSFHRFYAGPEGSRAVLKNMTSSFLTTVCCFVPLLFSSFSLLFQVAVFTLGGLTGTFLWVLVAPVPKVNPPAVRCPRFVLSRRSKAAFVALDVFIVLMGVGGWHLNHSPSVLYQPSPALQREEALFAKLNGPAAGRLLWVRGDTLWEALAKEESLRQKHDFFGLSVLLPANQEQNRQFVQRLYKEQSAALQSALGLTFQVAYKETPAVDEKAFWDAFLMMSAFVVRTPRDVWTVTPVPADVPDLGDKDVLFFEPAKHLSAALDRQATDSYGLLAVSFLLLAGLLGVLYRGKAPLYLLPSVIGSLGTLSILALCGESLTFFHWLGLFVVVGLSMDYTVFLFNSPRESFRPVLFSFLTSFIGFGLLSFIHFPMIAIMGKTLALGLGLSFLFSFILSSESIDTPVANVRHGRAPRRSGTSSTSKKSAVFFV